MTKREPHAEALRRGRGVRRTSAAVLDLGDLLLTELPKELGQLRELRVLALGNNAVTVRGDEIAWKWQDTRPKQAFSDLSALRELTALQSLDLWGCAGVSDLSVLRGLTALQSLDLWGCAGVSDLSALRGLTALQSLDLYECAGVSDLSALRGLTALQSLDLDGCIHVRRFLPLRPLLEHLTELHLHGCVFDDLPVALCGSSYGDNVLTKVRAHLADLDRGANDDAERKLFVLGNGGVGKTQTRRRLCGQNFDPTIPSTHGIEIEDFSLTVEGITSPVTLRTLGLRRPGRLPRHPCPPPATRRPLSDPVDARIGIGRVDRRKRHPPAQPPPGLLAGLCPRPRRHPFPRPRCPQQVRWPPRAPLRSGLARGFRLPPSP